MRTNQNRPEEIPEDTPDEIDKIDKNMRQHREKPGPRPEQTNTEENRYVQGLS